MLTLISDIYVMYTFNSKSTDGQSIIHLINTLKSESIIGAELGVGSAVNFCTILQNCPRITKMYGIDAYLPYTDFLRIGASDGTPCYSIGADQINSIRLTAEANIQHSGNAHKVIFYKENSSSALSKISDSELDFIFLDAYMTRYQAELEITEWYSKVKVGGIFAGHDWDSHDVQYAVLKLIKMHNIKSHISVFDNTWVFIK
jgi:hypothetical protein